VSTVKIRPDQPLFKADAFRMPLWIHAPWEVARGFTRWMTATLARDNPLPNRLKNATFGKPAKEPHRVAFWTGRPVVKGPKWRVIARRWASVFTFLCLVKYLPGAYWLAWLRGLGDMLAWIGVTALPWMWAHLWSIPLLLGVGCLVAGGGIAAFKSLRAYVRTRFGLQPWYVTVLRLNDRLRGLRT
jgi:hypothetical protein